MGRSGPSPRRSSSSPPSSHFPPHTEHVSIWMSLVKLATCTSFPSPRHRGQLARLASSALLLLAWLSGLRSGSMLLAARIRWSSSESNQIPKHRSHWSTTTSSISTRRSFPSHLTQFMGLGNRGYHDRKRLCL